MGPVCGQVGTVNVCGKIWGSQTLLRIWFLLFADWLRCEIPIRGPQKDPDKPDVWDFQ